MAYEISNANGMTGRAWTSTYDTQGDAAEALREAMGWSAIILSDAYATDRGDAVSAYETQSECDADQDGARAPRITVAP